MNIKMKKKFLFLFMLVFLLGSLGFVYSEDENLIDICAMENPPITCGESLSLLGANFDISEEGILSFLEGGGKLILNRGQENEIVLEGTEGIEITDLSEITFTGEDAKVTINGNTFENIFPAEKREPPMHGNEAFININKLTGEISKCEFWTKGGNYSINKGVEFYAPSGSLVSYNSLIKGVLHLEGREDTGNVKLNSVSEPITISGYKVEVAEGYILDDGELYFDSEGRIFIPSDEKARINNIEIKNKKWGTNDLPVFLGIESEEGISLLKDKLIFSGKEGNHPHFIEFYADNPYIKIEEGDYVRIFPSSKNSKMVLENRNAEGLIPKISFSGEETYSIIQNDGKEIILSEGKFFLKQATFLPDTKKESTTSPIEISFKERGNEKVFVDNFNRFAIVPGEVGEYIAKYEGIDVKFSRVKYNYLDEENIGDIIGTDVVFGEFMEHVDEGTKQMVLGRLKDYWETLTPETKDSIKSITISDDAFSISHRNAGAFADSAGGITFRESSESFKLDYFRHEAAHVNHYELKQDWIKNYPDYIEKNEEINGKIDSLQDTFIKNNLKIEDYPEKYWELKKELKNMKKTPFDKEWEEIAGNYRWVGLGEKGYFYLVHWGDPLYQGDDYAVDKKYGIPYAGYVSPYGGSKLMEDVAEFVGKTNDPEFFKPLLSEENEWHEIYRQKLDLLYKYKFISKKEWNAILEVAET